MFNNTGNTAPTILIIVGLTLALLAGVWMFKSKMSTEREPSVAVSETAAITPEQVNTIVGRWRRPDGGYVIDIRGLDADGHLDVAYYNPNPINVSKAEIVTSAKGLAIFIELQDKGYPGATYRLEYDKAKDLMAGIYHQPAVGQSFEVVFGRVR